MMIENVIGTFGLRSPSARELPREREGRRGSHGGRRSRRSVAAVSNMAKLVRAAGGFVADADRGVMIGQILIVGATDVQDTMDRMPEIATAPGARGPPCTRAFATRSAASSGWTSGRGLRRAGEPAETSSGRGVHLDCLDAMGANMVNTVCERLAPEIERSPGLGRDADPLELASRRLARARCTIPTSLLAMEGGSATRSERPSLAPPGSSGPIPGARPRTTRAS
jgi:hydroxymethylglutaryl-CoA reductase